MYQSYAVNPHGSKANAADVFKALNCRLMGAAHLDSIEGGIDHAATPDGNQREGILDCPNSMNA